MKARSNDASVAPILAKHISLFIIMKVVNVTLASLVILAFLQVNEIENLPQVSTGH